MYTHIAQLHAVTVTLAVIICLLNSTKHKYVHAHMTELHVLHVHVHAVTYPGGTCLEAAVLHCVVLLWTPQYTRGSCAGLVPCIADGYLAALHVLDMAHGPDQVPQSGNEGVNDHLSTTCNSTTTFLNSFLLTFTHSPPLLPSLSLSLTPSSPDSSQKD